MNNPSLPKRILMIAVYYIGVQLVFSGIVLSILLQNYQISLTDLYVLEETSAIFIDIMAKVNFYGLLIGSIVFIVLFRKDLLSQIKQSAGKWLLIIKTTGIYYVIYILLATFYLSLVEPLLPSTSSQNQELVAMIAKSSPMLMIIATVFLAPFIEEFVFRYALINVENKSKFSKSLIISSLIFGFIHVYAGLQNGQFHELLFLPQYALMGYMMGLIYLKTDTLMGAIFFHIINNLIAVVALFA